MGGGERRPWDLASGRRGAVSEAGIGEEERQRRVRLFYSATEWSSKYRRGINGGGFFCSTNGFRGSARSCIVEENRIFTPLTPDRGSVIVDLNRFRAVLLLLYLASHFALQPRILDY